MKKCWICKYGVLSDEHKFKSSDLRRNYGKNYKYGKENLQYFNGDSSGIKIVNYKDDLLKFLNCICVECNNNLTKPHDNAYDEFIYYVSLNYERILREQLINFEDVFNSDYQVKKRNLYKYFAKHAGCKIVTGKIQYDVNDLSEFILNDKSSQKFMLHFQIKEGIKRIMDKIDGYYHLYNGPTTYIQLSNEVGFTGWQSYHWFSTNWYYSSELATSNRINDNKVKVVEIKHLNECIKNEDELNIHRIELCGIETIDKIMDKFILMTEKGYNNCNA